MLGRTHQIIGVTSGLATYIYVFPLAYSPATFGTALVAAHIAALLPDIDQPASTIWRSLPFGRVGGALVNPFLKHRNLTHSALGYALVGWGLHALFSHLPPYWGIHGDQVWIVAMIAYGSHLLADALTVEGIPFLFPYPKMYGIPPYPFAGLRIQTGHWFENLLIFPFVNLVLLSFIYLEWRLIHQILFR